MNFIIEISGKDLEKEGKKQERWDFICKSIAAVFTAKKRGFTRKQNNKDTKVFEENLLL